MTITMTSKNQITLPKRIVDNLHLNKGALFDVKVNRNRIELIPLEVTEKTFTEEDFKRLDLLVKEEKKKGAKKVTREFIDSITKA
jgi:AbrB family looped-hinge helix DNA binding protein